RRSGVGRHAEETRRGDRQEVAAPARPLNIRLARGSPRVSPVNIRLAWGSPPRSPGRSRNGVSVTTTTTTTAAPPQPKTGRSAPDRKRRAGVGRLALLLLSPTILALALVVGYPVVAALRLSFLVSADHIDPDTGFRVTSQTLGLDNYSRIFS